MENLLLIASGKGTDAAAIMEAWKQGMIPEVRNIVLVSTKAGAGCLDKATACGVEAITLPVSVPLTPSGKMELQLQLLNVCQQHDIFLVGCNVVLPVIPGIPMYNIHPACPILHGGKGMHGLKVHKHVLRFFLDEIARGKKELFISRFFTYPTVHEVTAKPDDGEFLLQGIVEIPSDLLEMAQRDESSLDESSLWSIPAGCLQEIVLPNEWMMLPVAVRMAIARIETRHSDSLRK